MSLQRRRKLQIERMEPRQVMAAYINEIHFAPQSGDNAEDQYIELRGAPNETLPTGTYFVVVCAAEGLWDLGDVHAVFDLSREQFGSNGLMVLMQSGAGYTVNPQAKLLKGFDGFLGAGVFSSDGNAKQFRSGSNNYFLIQSNIAPTLTTDIDSNDDGLPDGAFVGWNVLDSVGVLPFYESAWRQRSFAQITFREDNVGAVLVPNVTSVEADQMAYVARINRSTGFAPADWVGGNTVEVDPKPSWQFQLQHGVFGTPRPFAYGGRKLDHIGSDNWVGSISGTAFQDDNDDGIQQPGEVGVAGVTVQASLNGEPNSGVEVASINPDNFPTGTDVSNALPYVTIVSAAADNSHQSFKVRVVQRAFQPTGDHIFAHEGVGFFYEDRRMRMDFYHPAQGVSIDFIGNSNAQATYGRLEIFNSANQSIGWVRTLPLGSGQKQRLSLTSATNEIAWALAYSENSYLNSSSGGMLENLEVIIPERTVVTDANGNYSLPALPNGNYNVKATPPSIYDFVFPNSQGQHLVTIAGNDSVRSKNFGLQGKLPPSLADQRFSASELLPSGSVLGTLPVVLGYPTQKLKYTITAGDPTGLFSINAATGQLILNSGSLDFETSPSLQLTVKIEDSGSAALNDTALVELMIEDRNEAPTVAASSKAVSEFATNGMNVATMTATDPDAGQAGVLTWSIVSGNIGNAFAIDADTGVVTVQDAAKIDFEQLASYAIVVRATDKGTPALAHEAMLSIAINDVNEAPIILGQSLSIRENSLAGTLAGTVTATDPDRNQSLQWQITGGNGSSLFEINPTSGAVRLAAGATLNFEQTSQFQLEIKATDSGTPAISVTRTLSVLVSDENDAPVLSDATFALAENSAGGVVVGTVQGTDEDTVQTLQYSLSGTDAASFTIDAGTGEVRSAAGKQFDFEGKNKFTVVVTATDNHEIPLQTSATITINLTNVNETPVLSIADFSVPENSAAGHKPGALTAFDEDSGDVLRWSILSQSQNWVSVDELTGELRVVDGAVIDFEGNKQSVLTVRVTDAAGASATGTVTLTASDLNDPPSAATGSLGSFTVKANQLFSYTLPAATFSDPDVGDQLNVFATLANGFPLPGWLSYNTSTRLLSGTPTANDGGTVGVKFTAIDQGGASAVASLSVVVDANLLPWHNATKPLDVTGDGSVTARDALIIINYLNTTGPGSVPAGTQPTEGWLDTSGDNSVSARDVLLVINDLNQQAAGEGEQAVDIEELLAWKRGRRG